MRITAAGNVGIGTTSPSLKLDVSGSDALLNDIRVGRGSGNRVTNSVLGYQVLSSNTTGFENVAIGYSTLASNTTGSFNTAIGSSTLLSNTTGYNNTAIGSYNLQFNTTGINNTALGYGALPTVTTGDKNTGIGVSAGTGITTGRANVIIGGVTGLSSSLSNNVIIADGDGNQRININSTGSVTLSDVLVLPFSNPLPSNRPTGSVAISGSGGTFVGMFVYNGTSWTNVKA
jgi:hypothetical protein